MRIKLVLTELWTSFDLHLETKNLQANFQHTRLGYVVVVVESCAMNREARDLCSAMDSRTSSEQRSSSQLVAFAEPNIFCLDEVRGKGKRPNGVYFNVARNKFLSSYNKASKKMNVVKRWIATGAWSNRHRNFELSLDESSEFGVRPRVLNRFLLSGRHSIVNY